MSTSNCGEPVVQRDDETEEAISNRLNVYNDQTAPLVGFYKNEGLLLSVNATSSDAVIDAIKERPFVGYGRNGMQNAGKRNRSKTPEKKLEAKPPEPVPPT